MTCPLAIDLFCGLGGWTEGLLSEGFDVIGFDIQRHQYGDHRYPGLLVIQDVRTLHGSQFKDAALIVASPPCQAYSYMAMPWKRAKAQAAAIRADKSGVKLAELTALFNACFRIQREACEAAGRHIPLIVENVKGAQPWVGRARWSFGSFYLWGDVPALMPIALKAAKVPGLNWSKYGEPGYKGEGFNTHADRQLREASEARKVPGFRFDGGPEKASGSFQSASVGVKHHGSGAVWFDTGPAALPSSSPRRKFASAMIAKIPLPLSCHVAATFARCGNA